MFRYIRTTILPSKPAQLLIKTGLKWEQDNCPGMAAALSYYALFSLFPLLLIVLSVTGWLIGPNSEVFQSIIEAAARYLPTEVYDLIRETIVSLNQNSVGAGIIGSSLLLFSASAVFSVLRNSVNRIWRSPDHAPEAQSLVKVIATFIVDKLLAFVLVFASAMLLLTSLISDIVVKTLLELITHFQQTFRFLQIDEILLAESLQVSTSFFLMAIVACILFKILPAAYVGWQDVWLSALLVALLLLGLQQLVSNSVISIGSQFLSYGLVGSVMILMLWIFLTFQIFLLGCVLSCVYAYLFGSRRNRSMN